MKRRLGWLGAVAGLAISACADPRASDEQAAPAAESAAAPSAEVSIAYVVPRTPWGDPDLRGMWPVDHMNGTPLQRPEELGERRYLTDAELAEREERLAALNARYDEEIAQSKMNMGHWVEMGQPNRLTSLMVEPADGRLPPLTAAGEAKSATMTSSWSDIPFEWIDDFNALDRCITRGLPASMFPFMYNSGIEIVQGPGVVAIRLELIHETRVIYTDGRPQLAPEIRQWMGESRGRWEGDALVVETTNFNGESPMLIVGPGAKPTPTSHAMRIVERLTRVGEDEIDYEIEVHDPEMLTAPWKAVVPWRRAPEYEIYEYACHEGNQIIRDLINITRHDSGRVQEGELMIPALRFAAARPGGYISTTDLISELEDEFQPGGRDAEVIPGRNDTYFSQKVRNLISHRDASTSMFSKGYAEHTGDGIRITDAGRDILTRTPAP